MTTDKRWLEYKEYYRYCVLCCSTHYMNTEMLCADCCNCFVCDASLSNVGMEMILLECLMDLLSKLTSLCCSSNEIQPHFNHKECINCNAQHKKFPLR